MQMKKELQLLFVSTVGEILPRVDLHYLVKPFSNEEVFIQENPALFLGYLKEIYPFLCYDFEELPIAFQNTYRSHVRFFTQVDGSIYQEKQIQHEKKK